MNQLFIKLYDFVTAPLYRRLARDLTIQLQEISQSYVDQHERLTAKLVDELLKMHVRLDNNEAKGYARDSVFNQSPIENEAMGMDMSAEQIYELMLDAANSIDTVMLCHKHNISLATYVHLEAKYKGCDPDSIRRARMLEATNFELTRLLATLLREKQDAHLIDHKSESATVAQVDRNSPSDGQSFIGVSAPQVKTENGNGRR